MPRWMTNEWSGNWKLLFIRQTLRSPVRLLSSLSSSSSAVCEGCASLNANSLCNGNSEGPEGGKMFLNKIFIVEFCWVKFVFWGLAGMRQRWRMSVSPRRQAKIMQNAAHSTPTTTNSHQHLFSSKINFSSSAKCDKFHFEDLSFCRHRSWRLSEP